MASLLNPKLTVEQGSHILAKVIELLGNSEAVQIVNPRKLGVLAGDLVRALIDGIESHPDDV